jgi:mono/diheme cytochrome c family protein
MMGADRFSQVHAGGALARGIVARPATLFFAAGAGSLMASVLVLAACASAGARSGGTEDVGQAAPAAPAAAPAPAALPAPAVPPAPAAPPAPSSPPTAPPATAAGDSPVAAYLADPQAMGRASQLFRAVCTGYCHSTQPAADRVAPNLFDCEWTHGSSDDEIFRTIYVGVPDTQMQGFGERLPQEDLWKLVAFLRQKSTC